MDMRFRWVGDGGGGWVVVGSGGSHWVCCGERIERIERMERMANDMRLGSTP